jgi:hypothetical protein
MGGGGLKVALGGRRGAEDRDTDPAAPLKVNGVRDRVLPLPSPTAEKFVSWERTSHPLFP